MFNNTLFNNCKLYNKFNKNYYKNKNIFLKKKIDKNILYNFFKKNKEIEKMEDKYEILKDSYIRLKAEMENYKKRSEEEISKIYKFAIEDFSKEFLEVIDSLELALLSERNSLEKISEGINLTLKIILKAFEKNNIILISPNDGEVFDPYKHLAVSVTNNPTQKDNVISGVLQKGYMIFERILRPALVVVNKV